MAQQNLLMKDHHRVCQELKDLSDQNLIDLGGALGLSYPRLSKMTDRLNQMVAAWLNQQDDVSDKPTWSTLINALQSVGQTGIAKAITEKNLNGGTHESSKVHQTRITTSGNSMDSASSSSKNAKLESDDEMEVVEKNTKSKAKRKRTNESEPESALKLETEVKHKEEERASNEPHEFRKKVTFPHFDLIKFNMSGELEEKERLRQNLYSESEEIMKKYQEMFSATVNSVKQENITVEQILCHLVGMSQVRPMYKHSKLKAFGCVVPDLEEADSVDKVMLCVGKYSSFFCFQMLECIIENLGTPTDKQNLAKYKEDFRNYAKRHVFMCPSEISERCEDSHADFYVLLDDAYTDCALNKLHSFVNELQKILHIPPGYGLILYHIGTGSLKLSFQLHFSLVKHVFPLTMEQEADLARLGVKNLWLIYQFSQQLYQEKIAKISNSEAENDSVKDLNIKIAAGADLADASLPVASQKRMIVDRKDIDSASIADSGHGTSVGPGADDLRSVSQYKGTCIDSASIADSGHGISICTDPIDEHVASIHTDSSSYSVMGKRIHTKISVTDLKQMVTREEHMKMETVSQDNLSEFNPEFYPVSYEGEIDKSRQQLQDFKQHKADNDSLHHAAANGDIDRMKYLIEEKDCNPAIPGQDGLTPLHVAAQQNKLEAVKFLIEQQNIDPQIRDEEGLTPLHRACEGGDLEVVCYLIDQLKEYMQPVQEIITEKTRTGNIPLHYASLHGHLEVVEHFISKLQCNPSIQGSQGRTALHCATEKGNFNIIKYLIEKGKCNPSHKSGGDKMTPLHIAAKFGWFKIVQYLSKEQNCDLKCKNSDGDTPLNVAALNGHFEVVKFFISVMKCDPNTPGEKNKTPMHNAAQGGHLDIIKYLIEVQKCDPSQCFGVDNVTPLHDAARSGQLEVVKYLTQEMKCNPLSKKTDGETPLNDATYGGHLDLADFFISVLKCDPNTPGEMWRIPLHLAVQQGHMHIVQYLIEKQKCDPSYCKGEDKVTPLHVASVFGRLDMVKYLTQDSRCNPLSKNAKGETALNDAALKGSFDVVQYFISEMNCNPNTKGEMGRVPLHLAAQGGHIDLVKYLREECHCDPSPVDDDNMTPLHLAAMFGHLNVVKYLVIDSHCNPSIEDSYPLTPLHYAARQGHIDIVKFFVITCQCPPNIKGYRDYTPLKLAELRRHTHVVNYLKAISTN